MKPKRNINTLSMSAIALILLMAATACGQVSDNTAEAPITVDDPIIEGAEIAAGDGPGSTAPDSDKLPAANNQTPSGELTEVEIEGLLYMREEEKLSRDVYLALSDIWGLPVFSNIAQSESSHMEAVLTLLDRYGLEDPAATTGMGVFINSTLQGLYDQLVAEGGQSLVDALRVGATIEEIDILDLEDSITQTNREDIISVYNNLMKGSRNHLRAFTSSIARQSGEAYQPQYLDQDAYAAIVDASTERGGWGNGGRGNGKGGNPNRGNP